jgi:hypothetical protein
LKWQKVTKANGNNNFSKDERLNSSDMRVGNESNLNNQ